MKQLCLLIGWLVFFYSTYTYFESNSKLLYFFLLSWGILTLFAIIKTSLKVIPTEKKKTKKSTSYMDVALLQEYELIDFIYYFFYQKGYTILVAEKADHFYLESASETIEVLVDYTTELMNEMELKEKIKTLKKNKEKRMIISNGEFSPQARWYGEENHVKLLGKNELEKLMKELEKDELVVEELLYNTI